MLASFFDTEGFMPHGMCLMWKPAVFWLHVVSDGLVAAAYYSIPFALLVFARRRADLAFPWIFHMFGAFILLCGTTHLMGIWTMWNPDYGVDGLIKFATGIVSIGTAVASWRLIPAALNLPSASQLATLNAQLTREVHERVRAETEVRRSNELLEARVRDRTAALEEANRQLRAALTANQRILESSRDIITTVDALGRIATISPAVQDTWGYGPEELIGRPYLDVVHPDDRERSAALVETVRAGQPTSSFQNRLVRRDGSSIPMLWSAVWSDADQRLYGVGRDLTERLDMEERLRRTQQLEAIGQLTGGVAHDFNNLLMVILGNAELLLDGLQDRPRLKALAEMTLAAAERGAELTHRLLAFARRQALVPKVVDANSLVSGMEALLRRTLGEHIEIEIVRSGGLWRTEVDPGQLDAAILNLALNARDAMPAGGRLTIETANARLDSDYAAQHPEIRPGQYVMIAISDTGQGMSGDVVRRAFEPFFTTKEVGKGTGLGLSMLYGFVQQSGGHIKIYSEPGQGTTVRMYFPRAEAPVTPATEPVVEVQPSAGSETILVVEDDALVRAHVAAQLTELGYRVIAAANGVEAMQILERETHVDLLFTDVVMPGGLNGRELASKARALRPGLRILFTSGYAENSVVHGGRLDAGVHLLAKPYRKRDLTQKVREVLDGPDPSRA